MNIPHEAPSIPLGDVVTITGTIVGRSEFASGRPTYLVEIEQKGKLVREWFHREDFEESRNAE